MEKIKYCNECIYCNEFKDGIYECVNGSVNANKFFYKYKKICEHFEDYNSLGSGYVGM